MKSKLHGVFSDELLKLETLPGPLLVDNMNNESSRAYGSFPDRLYIVLNEKIVYMVCIFLHLLVILFTNIFSIFREEWDRRVTMLFKLKSGLTNIFFSAFFIPEPKGSYTKFFSTSRVVLSVLNRLLTAMTLTLHY